MNLKSIGISRLENGLRRGAGLDHVSNYSRLHADSILDLTELGLL